MAYRTLHGVLRLFQILMLIPAWALLAAVIDYYNRNGTKTPGAIIFLFVVTLLASVWAFCVLVTSIRARNTALWMSFFDIVAMALLIAAVVVLSDIANADCIDVSWNSSSSSSGSGSSSSSSYSQGNAWWNTRIMHRRDTNVNVNGTFTYRQHCAQVKIAWGLAIGGIILFFFTAILAAAIYFQTSPLPTAREKVIVQDDHAAVGVPPSGHYYHDHRHRRHSGVTVPPPVFTDPYYGPPPARHSRDYRSGSHRSGSHRSRHGSYYEGSRRGSESFV